ncbi:hypothetical protein CQA38_01675 [Campylobacter sp. MIT 12-5580]|uniref:hypothetical protein n=1 Tax=Campylobacter sp. MIT 12-5580 TaxID=2040651 RepID=UPI00113708A2|nr:hypothetical protein [Campylobacter sp. MIT 12-5580]TKX30370.1 hypothetical protein CQA38_01675 [Campylobacter sp. MIT 12-5580]
MNYSLVLENELLLEYERFKQCKLPTDRKKIELLLALYKPWHIINKDQISLLEKNGLELDNDEKLRIMESGYGNLSLEDLAKITLYKIILTMKSRKGLPYVNIHGGKIENNYVATFKTGVSRQVAIDHFSLLFKNCKSIFFYDKYLKSDDLRNFMNQCNADNIKIYLTRDRYENFGGRNFGMNINIDQRYSRDYNESKTHDRYILVEYEVYSLEIILTSGMEHLISDNKDFTYIIRVIEKHKL